MKILILNYEYPPLGGGGGVATKKLAEAYVQLGFQVDYVTTAFTGFPNKEIINGVRLYRIKMFGRKNLANASLISLILFPLLAYSLVQQLCKKSRYDFISTHFAVPTGPLGVLISKKYKIKNILTVYGGDIYDPTKTFSPHRWWVLRKCINWVLNESDAIVSESEDIKKNVYKYYSCNKNVTVIPLPYNKIAFRELSREDLQLDGSAKYLISVGRLVKRKGFDFLIQCMARLDDKTIKLIIIGDGPEKIKLQELIYSQGLNERVTLLGSVSEEQKFQYLNTSNIYILSSVHEGFGIVLQEAMQVGLPIISTNHGGQVDFIKEGINGYLIDFGDIETLVEHVNRLLDNKNIMESISLNNINKVLEFSSLEISRKYLEQL